MSDILPFGSVTECPKCGERFYGEHLRFYAHYKSRHGPSRRYFEHLLRECGRCGFTWRERCKDHKDSPTETNDE
jgi:uncharacterized Zn finger protein